MEDFPFADLEAELGCLDTELPDPGKLLFKALTCHVLTIFSAPRRDHGDSDLFFDPPIETLSRLKSPSKTKSFHCFGDKGTLAWITHAGELMSTANCIQNRLIGVDYKKSLDRGHGYHDRAKMLEKAVNSPQGSGYAIGVSLDIAIEPSDVFWVHNRWPRFRYRSGPLDIRLQYYVDSSSVVQQLQIRNDTEREEHLPYTFSSDICFLEHEFGDQKPHPVPTRKSLERLLIFQNSEVVVRNVTNKAQLKMKLFFNAQRIPVWTKQLLNSDDVDSFESNDPKEPHQEMHQAENRLRNTVLEKKYPSYSDAYEFRAMYSKYYGRKPRQKRFEHNFAQHRSRIVIPAHSTQELCAIIQLTRLPQHEVEFGDECSGDNTMTDQRSMMDEEYTNLSTRMNNLTSEFKDLPSDLSNPEHRSRVHKCVGEHLSIGEACAEINWLGEARYHFHLACLIAESCINKDLIFVSETKFRYANFLNENEWDSDAFQIFNDLLRDLSAQASGNADVTTLWTTVLRRLALLYQAKGDFATAENLYEDALSHFVERGGSTERKSTSNYLLERQAWTQVRQGKYEKADKNYSLLLNQSLPQRRILLRNRGFIKRQNLQLQEAQSLYETALSGLHSECQEPWNRFHYTADALYSLSGLFACTVQSHTNVDDLLPVSAFSTGYLDMNKSLMSSPYHRFPFIEEPLHFAIARQLEFLLSVCSIPVKGKSEAGIAFADADPLNCACESRAS